MGRLTDHHIMYLHMCIVDIAGYIVGVCLFAVLETKSTALHTLGKYATTDLYAQPLLSISTVQCFSLLFQLINNTVIFILEANDCL